MATAGATPHDGADRTIGISHRARRVVTETKAAFKTTEFWAMLGLIVAILVSAAVIKGGDNGTDEFIARQAWLYVSILGAAYFISRGLAKRRQQRALHARPGAARRWVVDAPSSPSGRQAGAGPPHARLPGDVLWWAMR